MPFNFKINLLESFVRVNAWDHVEDLIGRIYDYKLDLTFSKSLLGCMLEALTWFIEPLYLPISKAKTINNINSSNAGGVNNLSNLNLNKSISSISIGSGSGVNSAD